MGTRKKTMAYRVRVVLVAMVMFCGLLYLGSLVVMPREIQTMNHPNGQAGKEGTTEKENTPSVETAETVQGDIHQGNLILVNNQTAFVEQIGQEKIDATDQENRAFQVARDGMLMEVTALQQVNKMVADYKAETGDEGVTIISAYRSVESQQEVMAEEIEAQGEEEARRFVTEPGYSEHHTGLAVDFSIYYSDGSSMKFGDSPAAAWFLEKGPSYGLIKRYAEDKESITQIGNEPWHFRYLGIPQATAIAKTSYCLEGYLDYLKQYTYEGEHLGVTVGADQYEIYYASGSEIQVPKGKEYSISGNNVDGLIATVKV